MNSRKKRFVNPIKIEVTRSARMETILGKFPAIFNGHQPPRADDPYVPCRVLVNDFREFFRLCILFQHYTISILSKHFWTLHGSWKVSRDLHGPHNGPHKEPFEAYFHVDKFSKIDLLTTLFYSLVKDI